MTAISIKVENTKVYSKAPFQPVAIVGNNTWLEALPPTIKLMVEKIPTNLGSELEEIRLRLARPIIFRLRQREFTYDPKGEILTDFLQLGYHLTSEDIERALHILSQSSLYAWEEELRNGYLPIPGGHRVGLVGKAVLDRGKIKTLKEISGLNYRIGREVLGCADPLLPYLIKGKEFYQTLIVSPPQCGKTTLLRDLVRQLSNGIEKLNFPGVNVGLVDERSELAGIYQGKPQFQIGLRTDVLDGCPKAQGMIMLIRSMSPRIIATDEIGRPEDIEALYQALQAGVSVITTVHGSSLAEIKERPYLKDLLQWGFFERIVLLSRTKGVGTIETIWDGKTFRKEEIKC